MSRTFRVSDFLLLLLLKLLKPTPQSLAMVVFSNSVPHNLKSKLFDIIQVYAMLHNRIIVQLKKKLYQLFYVFYNFKMIFLIKSLWFVLTEKVRKDII